MPIKRPCLRPGCPGLVRKGYCTNHQPKRERTKKKRFYDTRRWRDGIRPMQLRREPLCEINEKCEDPTIATHVHHKNGDVTDNTAENLTSCCNPCHTWWERKHGALA